MKKSLIMSCWKCKKRTVVISSIEECIIDEKGHHRMIKKICNECKKCGEITFDSDHILNDLKLFSKGKMKRCEIHNK